MTLANLLLVRMWTTLLAPIHSPADLYFMDGIPPARVYWGSIAALVLLTSLIWAAWGLLDRWRPVAGTVFVFVALLLGLNAARQATLVGLHGLIARWGPLVGGAVVAGAAAAGLWILLRFPERVRPWTERLALILLPFAALTLGQVGLVLKRHADITEAMRDRVPSQLPAANPVDRRVVLVLFDQMGVTHVSKASISLPALRALRDEALVGWSALPSTNATVSSVPALIFGRLVKSVAHTTHDAELVLYDGRHLPFAGTDSTFSWVRKQGGRSALVGWYNPYCRVLSEPDYCQWTSAYPGIRGLSPLPGLIGTALLDALPGGARFELARSLGIDRATVSRSRYGWGPKTALQPAEHAARFSQIHDAAKALVTRDDIDFIMIHYPVPHGPEIFDANRDQVSVESPSPGGNLILTDHVLRDLRSLMEDAHLWDKTVLIVTADHAERPIGPDGRVRIEAVARPEHRVPFLMRLPGASALDVTQTFRTPALARLVPEILSGAVRTSEQVARRLLAISAEITPPQVPRVEGADAAATAPELGE